MLYIVICDDNADHNHFLQKWVNMIIEEQGMQAKVALVAERAEDVLDYALEYTERINVYILDIELAGNTNGLELARKIRRVDRKSYFIFITGHKQYTFDSFQVKTFDYLLKPVTFSRFESSLLNLYHDYLEMGTLNSKIPLKSGSSVYMVNPNDIIYFEKDGPLLKIYLTSGLIKSYEPLKKIAAEYEVYGFIRCHRSYVVNPHHVLKISFSDNSLLMSNGDKCYFSRKYKKEIQSRFTHLSPTKYEQL